MLAEDDDPHADRQLTAAISLVAAVEHCTPDDAARLLVAAARRADRPLANVAADVVQAARLAMSCLEPIDRTRIARTFPMDS